MKITFSICSYLKIIGNIGGISYYSFPLKSVAVRKNFVCSMGAECVGFSEKTQSLVKLFRDAHKKNGMQTKPKVNHFLYTYNS